MDVADRLCDRLLAWLDIRRDCVSKLLALARFLERMREATNVAQVSGSAVAVAGSLSVIGAGALTFFTAGLATPVLVMAVGGTTASLTGAAISAGASIIEKYKSSSTMEEAEGVIKRDLEIGQEIQKLLTEFSEECEGQGLPCDGDSKQHQMTDRLLQAMARRSGIHLPDNFLDRLKSATFSAAVSGSVSFYTAMQCKLASPVFKKLLINVLQDVGYIGLKQLTKGAARVAGGVFGLVLSLPELLESTGEMIRGNHITQASKALRDAAQNIEEAQQEIRDKLKPIQEMLQEMVEVHQAFKDLDETTDITDRKFKIITEYVSNYYADALGRQWLQKENNQKRFANEIQLFRNYFKNFQKEKERREDESSRERSKRRYRKRKLDIVFIAHGSITDDSIPASELISPSVDDLVLYSPWNCSITAQVAYGIASGKIQPPDRLFINMVNNHDVAAAEALLPPSLLPPHWNSMSSAGGALIPWVWVSPAVDDEPVDQCLMYFIQEGGVDRLVIRYIVPSWLRSVFVPVPLFVVMYALSFMLSVAGYTAKVHLAACLPYQSPINSEPWRRKRQYACTYDRVAMTNRNIDAHLRNHIRSAYEKVFEFPSREADYRH